MMQQKLTRADKAWTAYMGFVLLSFMFIGMFVTAAYLTPALLHLANNAPHNEKQDLIGFLLLMGSVITADLAALLFIRYSIRLFMTPEIYSRWRELYVAGRTQVPWLYRKGCDLCFKVMMPRKLRKRSWPVTAHGVYGRDHHQPV